MANATTDRRRFFRLHYPPQYHPGVAVQGREYRVIELSEGGVRFHCPKLFGFALGMPLTGIVHFPSGEDVIVQGKIIRMSITEVIIQLTKGIPLRIMLAEQRGMINKFQRL